MKFVHIITRSSSQRTNLSEHLGTIADMMLPTLTGLLSLSGFALGYAITKDDISAASVWKPAVGATWQIILQGSLKLDASSTSVTPNVEIYDIDLFTNTKNGADRTVIDALHRLNKKVICYFSAGSYEPNRPDSGKFNDADIGNELNGWPGEHWLNLNSQSVRDIMAARVQLAAKMGCDAIDPDNVDGSLDPLVPYFSHILLPPPSPPPLSSGGWSAP